MIITSRKMPESFQFSGYAWIDADLIVNSAGANIYRQIHGGGIWPGEDGCYVSLQKCSSHHWVLGTDYRGLQRIYLYRSGRRWAASNSFTELIDEVRALGWPLTVVQDSLKTFGIAGSFYGQLSSFDAHFNEVTLVPSIAYLEIRDGLVDVRFRSFQPSGEYDSALYDYLSTWKSRTATLARTEETFLRFDLSGGIDSRAVLAFGLAVPEALNDPQSSQVVSSTAPHQTADLKVATNIAGIYGFELNGPGSSQGHKAPFNKENVLSNWRTNMLGVYAPFYAFSPSITPTYIHAHGAGGGNFRPTYPDLKRVSVTAKKRLSDDEFERWSDRVDSSLSLLQHQRPNVTQGLLHYREFRNRFHFGSRPLTGLIFMPLESKFTDALTDRGDSRETVQLYYDVMESLSPGLMDLPYDDVRKGPSKIQRSRLTTVELSDPKPGAVYWDNQAEQNMRSGNATQAFSDWIGQINYQCMSSEVKNTLSAEELESIAEVVQEFETTGKKPRANAPGVRAISKAFLIKYAMK